MDRLAHFEGVSQILARGGTKSSVRLRNGLQLDLRVVPEATYGAALQYFTGSKQHNILIRRMGIERGLKINEYGVFRGARRIAVEPSKKCTAPWGCLWIPPELREGRNEIELARAGKLPALVELVTSEVICTCTRRPRTAGRPSRK